MAGETAEAMRRNRIALEQCVDNLEEVLRAAGLGTKEGMEKVLIIIDNYVTAELMRPGHGRLYKKTRAKRSAGKGTAWAEAKVEKNRAKAAKLRGQASQIENRDLTIGQKDLARGLRMKADRLERAPGGFHRASAPGEPPAPDTGNLVGAGKFSDEGGFFTDIEEGERGEVIGVIGTNVEYAPHLEFGTRHMMARPFFRPGIARATEDISRQIAEAAERRERITAEKLRTNFSRATRARARKSL